MRDVSCLRKCERDKWRKRITVKRNTLFGNKKWPKKYPIKILTDEKIKEIVPGENKNLISP